MADESTSEETPTTVETPAVVVPDIKSSFDYATTMANLLQPVGKGEPVNVEVEDDADLALLTSQVDKRQGVPVEKMNTEGLPDDIWEAGFEDRQTNKPAAEETSVVTPEAVVETPAAVVDPHEAMVIAIRVAQPGISLKAAMKAADAALGESATVETTEEAPAVPAVETLTAELKQIQKVELLAANREARKLARDLAPEADQEEAEAKITALEARMLELEEMIPQAQEVAISQYNKLAADMAVHGEAAKKAFPLLNDPTSPFVARCNAIHDAYEKAGSPIVSNPRKAMLIAAEAFAEMGGLSNPIFQQKGTASPAATKTAPVSPAHMTAPIASPSTRTTTYNANPIGREIDTIKSDEEYTAMMRKLTAKR